MEKTQKIKMLTSKMAAEILSFTPSYIRRLILNKKIRAEKIGHDWLIRPSDIKNIKRQRNRKGDEK